ncbi:MAG: hypothetical protein ACJAUA_001268 [Zhongshania aliphaticivorans]|jgi:hypothetical protein
MNRPTEILSGQQKRIVRKIFLMNGLEMLKKIILIIVWTSAFSLDAGPIGYFRTEKGARIKGEVMYADDVFYYYRRVSNPEEMLTIKIENVPVSFQRIVNSKRLKGEITSPPESIAQEDDEVVEQPYGEWQLQDESDGDLSNHFAILSTKDEQERLVQLFTRYSRDESTGFQKFDIFLVFSDEMMARLRFNQVTYQLNSDEQINERWITAYNSFKAFFSPTSFGFRDKLLKSDDLSFVIIDKAGETRRFSFNVSHFDQVYKDIFEPLIVMHEIPRSKSPGRGAPWLGIGPPKFYYDVP